MTGNDGSSASRRDIDQAALQHLRTMRLRKAGNQ